MTEVPKKKITREGLRNAFKLYSYIRPFMGEYMLGMFFLLGSSLSSLAFPKLLGNLVNAGNEGSLGQTINQTALLLGIILLVQSTFSYFRVVLFVNVTEKSLASLRREASTTTGKHGILREFGIRVGEAVPSLLVLATPSYWTVHRAVRTGFSAKWICRSIPNHMR